MFTSTNFKGRLFELIATVAQWIKRDRPVGPIRATDDVIDGGGSDERIIGKLCVADDREYIVLVYDFTDAEGHQIKLRPDSYRIVLSRDTNTPRVGARTATGSLPPVTDRERRRQKIIRRYNLETFYADSSAWSAPSTPSMPESSRPTLAPSAPRPA